MRFLKFAGVWFNPALIETVRVVGVHSFSQPKFWYVAVQIGGVDYEVNDDDNAPFTSRESAIAKAREIMAEVKVYIDSNS